MIQDLDRREGREGGEGRRGREGGEGEVKDMTRGVLNLYLILSHV